ncbi:hypothetical protein [Magnetovibrio blakemorei]|uniref:Uncharacterized protein n=1 Tax=Magnetovibrio blakemorei TaxID=28181 RepID=A0A1E5Q6S0_9PROT|nr:hypothetical protein [Magnetovibrio blakemorei]OEJ66583.1 hypothetical protein BEN30_12040 [Magnetovibrio blakemorei]
MMTINEMIQTARDWDGTNVSDIFNVVRVALGAANDEASEQYIDLRDIDWFDQFRNVLNDAGHPDLWPEDLSNCFKFLTIDETGRAICCDHHFSPRSLAITLLSDEEEGGE